MPAVSVMTDQLGLDFESSVKQLSHWGVQWVDLRGGIYGKRVDDLTDDELEQARSYLEEYRLMVSCIATMFASPWQDHDLWDEKDWEGELHHLERLIELAKAFDTDLMRVYGYRKPNPDVPGDRPNLDDFIEPISQRLREAASMAARHDLVLVLENETFSVVGTCLELRQVLEAVNHKALLACWDVANGWACGEDPYPQGYEEIKDMIGYVHIKGAKGQPDDPSIYGGVALLGEDDLPYGTILRALVIDGYGGKLALHPHHNLFGDEYKLKGQENPDLRATWLTLQRVQELLASIHE